MFASVTWLLKCDSYSAVWESELHGQSFKSILRLYEREPHDPPPHTHTHFLAPLWLPVPWVLSSWTLPTGPAKTWTQLDAASGWSSGFKNTKSSFWELCIFYFFGLIHYIFVSFKIQRNVNILFKIIYLEVS